MKHKIIALFPEGLEGIPNLPFSIVPYDVWMRDYKIADQDYKMGLITVLSTLLQDEDGILFLECKPAQIETLARINDAYVQPVDVYAVMGLDEYGTIPTQWTLRANALTTISLTSLVKELEGEVKEKRTEFDANAKNIDKEIDQHAQGSLASLSEISGDEDYDEDADL